MIPSRPLDLGGIIGESIRIVKRTYWRAALLFIIFTAPGILVIHYGLDNALDGGQGVLQEFSDASPDAIILFRDYVVIGSSRSNTFSLYRIIYPKFFHIVDSVSEKIKSEYPDSAQSKIQGQLDSIAKIVSKKTGKPPDDLLLSQIDIGLIIIFAGIFLFILGLVAASGALYDLACRAYEERPFPLGSIFRFSLTQSMWLLLIQYVLIFLAMIAGLGLVVTISLAISPIFGVLGMLVAIFFLIYATLRILFCNAALVCEELGPIVAIKRSLELTKHSFWRVFGICLICGIMIYIASALIQMLLSLAITADLKWLIEFFQGNKNMTQLFRDLKSDILNLELVSFISSALTIAFLPAFLTTFYYDLRTHREGELEYPETEVLRIENSENPTIE